MPLYNPDFEFSFANNCKDKPCHTKTLLEWCDDIKYGTYEKDTLIAREKYTRDKGEYKRYKTSLPIIMFGGRFSPKKDLNSLQEVSHILIIDIDGLSAAELNEQRQKLKNDGHVLCLFTTLSGYGLKALFICEYQDNLSYNKAWKQIASYLHKKYSINADETGKNLNRLCTVTFDKDLYLNMDAKEFFINTEIGSRKTDSIHLTPQFQSSSAQEKYILKVIQTQIANIINAPEHQGNNKLYLASLNIAKYEHLGLFRKEKVTQCLINAYLYRGNHHTESEAITTINSGWNTGITTPQDIL